MQTKGQKISQ